MKPGLSDAPVDLRPPGPGRASIGPALLVAGLAATFGLGVMSSYGVTIDAPSLFYAGDRTLFWLLNPRVPGALNFLGPEPRGFRTAFERHPEEKDPLHYPVLPGLLAATTSRVFHERLGWVDVVDGHLMALVLLHAASIFFFGLYVSRLLGPLAGIAAALLLGLFPSALGHSFNNAKDWPCAQFYGLAVLAAGAGILEARARHVLAAGVFVGLALSCKLNGIFVLPTVLAWTPIAYLLLYRRRRPVSASLVGAGLLVPYVAGLVFFALWPWLYYGRLPDWWRHIHWYVSFMVDYGVGHRAGWTAHPFECLLFMTPPLVLALAVVYAIAGGRGGRERAAVHALLLLWLALPLIRIAAPGSNFYDANRHFIEYVPALCAMAGGGVALALEGLRAHARRPRAAWVMGTSAVLGLASVIWPILEYHPYETTYFNVLAGGLGGAQRRALFRTEPWSDRLNGTEGDYWYSSLRAGLRDLEAFSPGGGTVGLCGPRPPQGRANLRAGSRLRIVEGYEATAVASLIYAAPRQNECDWQDVRALEGERPILRRVERGGGLIYEVLGPRDGVPRTPVTGPTGYDEAPDPSPGAASPRSVP